MSLSVVAACVVACATVQFQPAPNPPDAPDAATSQPDTTRSFRRLGELVARCGGVTVIDLGLWPDMMAAMEGKGPLYVNRPLNQAINDAGQVVVVTQRVPAEGVTRDINTGLVQYVINGRPTTGVLNSRGDLFGQIIIDNPQSERDGDRDYNRYLTRSLVLFAGENDPIFLDAPAGHHIEAVGLSDEGVGLGMLIKGHFFKGEVSHTPVSVKVDRARRKATFQPLISQAALPKGVDACVPAGIDARGNILVAMQTPTGEVASMMMRGENGQWEQTCPSFIETAGLLRDGRIELIPMPSGYAALSAVAISPAGVIVADGERWDGKARFSDPFCLQKDKVSRLAPAGARATCCSDTLVCGVVSAPRTLSAAQLRAMTDAQRDLYYNLESCGAIWDAATGRMIPLDALLPPGSPCAHLGTAAAISGRKVLCLGLIEEKLHAVVVTLPPPERLAAAFTADETPAR